MTAFGQWVIISYKLTKSFQQCSVTLNIRDNKIVEKAILVSGDWDHRFLWVFIYKTIPLSAGKERTNSSI